MGTRTHTRTHTLLKVRTMQSFVCRVNGGTVPESKGGRGSRQQAVTNNISCVFVSFSIGFAHYQQSVVVVVVCCGVLLHCRQATIFSISLFVILSLLFVLNRSRSYVNCFPRPCFKHVSMGQARNPPTERTSLSAWSVLSRSLWPCYRRMCVITEGLGSLHGFAHAAGRGYLCSASTAKRAVSSVRERSQQNSRLTESR